MNKRAGIVNHALDNRRGPHLERKPDPAIGATGEAALRQDPQAPACQAAPTRLALHAGAGLRPSPTAAYEPRRADRAQTPWTPWTSR